MSLSYLSISQEDVYYRATRRPKHPPVLANRDLVTTNHHWYIGAEAGGSWNGTAATGSLEQFLAYRAGYTAGYIGGYAGYCHHQRWLFEGGYLQQPVHIFLSLFTARRPVNLHLSSIAGAIPLRVKRRVLRFGNVQKQSGIYVGAGVLLPFHQAATLEDFRLLVGYARIAGSQPARFDTLTIRHLSVLTGQGKIQWESSLEVAGRIARQWELVAYGRAHYATRSVLRSESVLLVNRQIESTAVLTLQPWAYQFGLSVRYLFKFRNPYRSTFEE
ncbi:MAG: hypothetical protein ACK4GN_09900 [Runella sp.]